MTVDTDLRDKVVRAALDRMDMNGICAYLDRTPHIDTHYATAPGWTVGDGRPVLASTDPAVMQALGVCAASRVRWSDKPTIWSALHPGTCGWCSYPLTELLAACSWSVWSSRHVLSETQTWRGADGSTYTIAGRHDVYENLEHALWWALPARERRRRVEEAIVAVREGMGVSA